MEKRPDTFDHIGGIPAHCSVVVLMYRVRPAEYPQVHRLGRARYGLMRMKILRRSGGNGPQGGGMRQFLHLESWWGFCRRHALARPGSARASLLRPILLTVQTRMRGKTRKTGAVGEDEPRRIRLVDRHPRCQTLISTSHACQISRGNALL